jgi:hypothetical protein
VALAVKRVLLAVLLVLTAMACTPDQGFTSPPAPSMEEGMGGAVSTSQPAASIACHVVDGKADRRCTPGALNPNVSQANIHGTICVPGWTATIRPPVGYTDRLKQRQKILYGETAIPDAQLEEDHLVSLSAGGSPTDPHNLYPQPRAGKVGQRAQDKDADEYAVQRDICAGRITLKQGQDRLLAKWSQ